MENTQKSKPAPLRKLGYASAVVGGGVVGADYATWMQVDPATGAVIGSAISTVITKILFYLQDDPGNRILIFLMRAGMLIGCITGAYFGYEFGMAEDKESVLQYSGAGLVGGGFFGAMAGKVVAGLISLSAFFLLFISRGPVGLYLRNALSNDEADSQIETTSSAILSAFENFSNFFS